MSMRKPSRQTTQSIKERLDYTRTKTASLKALNLGQPCPPKPFSASVKILEQTIPKSYNASTPLKGSEKSCIKGNKSVIVTENAEKNLQQASLVPLPDSPTTASNDPEYNFAPIAPPVKQEHKKEGGTEDLVKLAVPIFYTSSPRSSPAFQNKPKLPSPFSLEKLKADYSNNNANVSPQLSRICSVKRLSSRLAVAQLDIPEDAQTPSTFRKENIESISAMPLLKDNIESTSAMPPLENNNVIPPPLMSIKANVENNYAIPPPLMSTTYRKINIKSNPANRKQNVMPLTITIENNTNQQLECICHRPERIVMCKCCGHVQTSSGRVRQQCPLHPRYVMLTDLTGCMECKSGDLQEFSH